MKVDGSITANAAAAWWSQGSGGSIWIAAAQLSGKGKIGADGGTSSNFDNGAGGGGRVAVWLTEAGADFSNFTLTNITANGGLKRLTKTRERASCGTVYLKTGDQAEDEGTLYIRNADAHESFGVGTVRISGEVSDTEVGRVVLDHGGRLSIAAGSSLTVKDGWSNGEPVEHFSADLSGDASVPHGEVRFVDATVEARIVGLNDFANLTCIVPGKTLRFGTDANADCATVNGVLTLTGDETNPVFVKSATDDTPWLLDVEGSAAVSYVTAWDSDASAGKPVVNVAGTIKNTQNWSVVTPIKPGATNTWTGADADHPNDWTSAANWSLDRQPESTDYLVIPSGCGGYPVLSANAVFNALVIRVGASLDIGGCDIAVTNYFKVAGTLRYAGGETITFTGKEFDFFNATLSGPSGTLNLTVSGTGAQTLDLANLAWNQVRLVDKSGSLAWRSGFTASKLECVATDTLAMTFAAGGTVLVRNLVLDGSGDGTEKLISLASSNSGTAWKLKVSQFASVIGVTVSDSNASESSIVIYADQPSQGIGTNPNWNFSRACATWKGGSGDFTDATKWSTESVPDASTLIIIESNATVNVNGETDPVVQELRVIGPDNKFSGSRTLRTAGAAQFDGGGLTLDVPLQVGGSMFLLNGSVMTHSANSSTDTKSLQLTVAGGLTIDATSKLSAQGKGYSKGASYPGSKSADQAAHGGRPRIPSSATACYGSVTCPTNSGSSTQSYGTGGGRIRVIVGGKATVDGAINANGSDGDWLSAAGGSVWATFGSLAGSGKISANGGTPSTNMDGGGGRVAVYLTASSDFDSFAAAGGVISAYGSRNVSPGSVPQTACGTVYLQGADGEKRIVLDNDGGCTYDNRYCYTDFPVPVERGGDDPKLYNGIKFVIRNRGAINLLSDLLVKDVVVETANTLRPSFFLNDHTLTIRSQEHKRRRGWATCTESAGTSGLGRIIWQPRGMMVIVR